MDFVKKEYANFTPVNSSQKYSPTNAQSIIRFQIPNGVRYLDGSLLRLNGKLNITGASNNVKFAKVTSVLASSLAGVSSMIQQVTINSFKTQVVLERNNNYGRMVTTLQSCNNDNNDYVTTVANNSLATATPQSTYNGLVNEGNAGDVPFSIPLFCGMLQGQPLPLSNDWGLGGLQIEIMLCNPLEGLYDVDDTGGGVRPSAGASFEWSDVSITAPLYTPSMPMLQQLGKVKTGAIEFMNWSNLYNVINSDNSVISYNLGLKNVVASFNNYIKTSALSSNENGMNNQDIGITSITYGMGGRRFPNEFKTIVEKDQQRTYADATNNVSDSQMRRQLLTAFRDYKRCGHNVLSNGEGEDQTFANGIRYDSLSSGVDLSATPYSFEIASKINEPTAVFSYFLSKNTMVYNNQTAMVSN